MRLLSNINPLEIFSNIWKNKDLIIRLTKREISARYKGSYLGILWTFITPLLMLLIYTFVFSEIFKSRWSPNSDNKVEFALIVFCGLIIFNVFAETITRSPGLILSNVNYVKKVVFPLEILPIVIFCSSLVQCLVSFSILTVGLFFLLGIFSWTIIYLPLVMLPLILLSLGLGWFLASLGVYYRDIGQIIGIAVQALMLLSPIFYPVTLIPHNLLFLYNLNPITYVIEDVRRVMVWGQTPQWEWLGFGTIIGIVVFVLGYAWFKRTKGGFPDVL